MVTSLTTYAAIVREITGGALLRRRLEPISFDPAAVATKGWRLRLWDFWFYLIFGVVITFSVPIGGVLLVFSFLVVPAVTALLFTRRPAILTVISWCTGAVASAAGLAISYAYDLPTGPTMVCAFGTVLLLAWFVGRMTVRTAAA